MIIVYFDGWSFNPSSLLYTWRKKGNITTKIIRSITKKCKSIDVYKTNNKYFYDKNVQWITNLLIKQLKLTLSKI